MKIDKIVHCETCALIVIIGAHFLPLWAGVLIAAVAGIGKEVWDIWHGVPSWLDLLADVVGIAIGITFCLI